MTTIEIYAIWDRSRCLCRFGDPEKNESRNALYCTPGQVGKGAKIVVETTGRAYRRIDGVLSRLRRSGYENVIHRDLSLPEPEPSLFD